MPKFSGIKYPYLAPSKTGKLLSKGMRSSEKSCYMFDCNLACALFGGLHTGK